MLNKFLSEDEISCYLYKIRAYIRVVSHSNSMNSFSGYGIYNSQNIFFKLVSHNDYKNYSFVHKYYSKYFKLSHLITTINIDTLYYLLIYEDYRYQYPKIYNGVQFLTDISIPLSTKTQALKLFYNQLFERTSHTLEYKYRSHYPSMIFFEERVGNKRLYKYY
jgi:hypothetical protein